MKENIYLYILSFLQTKIAICKNHTNHATSQEYCNLSIVNHAESLHIFMYCLKENSLLKAQQLKTVRCFFISCWELFLR